MTSKTVLTLFAIAMVISLTFAWDDDNIDDDSRSSLLDELAKRNAEEYEEFLSLEKRAYPRCRHWLTRALCRCNRKFGTFDERRYTCSTTLSRGYKDVPFA